MNNNVNIIVGKDVCSGCGACSVRCPKACISMHEVEEAGFVYPVVDEQICVDCGACVKACPVMYDNQKSMNLFTYAARAKDKEFLKTCNSGGIFSLLAKVAIERGGYACGAAYAEDLSVHHIVISSLDKLERLQGSKYVQSETYTCFDEIKQLLQEGKELVFCGTGCQIAGLKNALVKTYDNLLTIELVCHGVPSPGLFRKYLRWLGEKSGGKIASYKFRSKHKRPTGEHSEFFYICNGKQLMGHSYEDPYYGSFLQGRTLRPSCYNCHFKGKARVGDITIGDFWGIEKYHRSFPTNHGHCMVMVNTEVGMKAFEEIKVLLDIVKSTYENASTINSSLEKSTPFPKCPVDYSADNLFDIELKPHLSFKNKIKNRLPWRVKMFMKRFV